MKQTFMMDWRQTHLTKIFAFQKCKKLFFGVILDIKRTTDHQDNGNDE